MSDERQPSVEREQRIQAEKAAAWDAISRALDRNARGESHASAADVCGVGFDQQKRLAKALDQ